MGSSSQRCLDFLLLLREVQSKLWGGKRYSQCHPEIIWGIPIHTTSQETKIRVRNLIKTKILWRNLVKLCRVSGPQLTNRRSG